VSYFFAQAVVFDKTLPNSPNHIGQSKEEFFAVRWVIHK